MALKIFSKQARQDKETIIQEFTDGSIEVKINGHALDFIDFWEAKRFFEGLMYEMEEIGGEV